MITLQELHDELVNDPNNYGFASMIASGSTNLIVDELNMVRSNITITKRSVSVDEVIITIDPAEYMAVQQAAKREWVQMLLSLSLGEVPTNNQNIINGIISIFGSNSNTVSALNVLRQRNGSRIEQLFDVDDKVTKIQVLDAINYVP